MINKISSFLKQSNRGKHLLGGFIVSWGASSPYDAVYAAAVAASCLELKDHANRTQSQARLSYAEAQPHLSKAIALTRKSKLNVTARIPKRQFMGESHELDEKVKKEIMKSIEKIQAKLHGIRNM